MDVTAAFDAVAGSYDQARRRLVPCFDDFYGTAVEVAAPPLRAALAAGRTPRCSIWVPAPGCSRCCSPQRCPGCG